MLALDSTTIGMKAEPNFNWNVPARTFSYPASLGLACLVVGFSVLLTGVGDFG
jgi:hypothetical protein